MSDNRRLTLIVVPHGDLDTRRFELSYRRLKVLLGVAALFVVVFLALAGSYWYVASKAARVPALEQKLERAKVERERVAKLARALDRVKAQYADVRALLGADEAPRGGPAWLPPISGGPGGADSVLAATDRPMRWPLDQPGYITRELTRGEGSHPGLDIAVPRGSPVYATAAGVVRKAGRDDVYGRYIVIDHGDVSSLYGHTSRLLVEVGDRVERGEVIARTGSSGRSTAPHLHFEIRKDGEIIDPLKYVTQPG